MAFKNFHALTKKRKKVFDFPKLNSKIYCSLPLFPTHLNKTYFAVNKQTLEKYLKKQLFRGLFHKKKLNFFPCTSVGKIISKDLKVKNEFKLT